MDRNHSEQHQHHERAMNLLMGGSHDRNSNNSQQHLNSHNELHVVDLGDGQDGIRSAWSPDHEFERDQQRPVTFAALGERFSRRMTTIAQQPEFWNKVLNPKPRRKIGWLESCRNLAFSSWLNLLLVFIPVAWALHFIEVTHVAKFSTAFLALIPLTRLLEYGGENMALYCGKDLGDLIFVTLNNAVEAALAVALLVKCELRLLQATIIGVVLLRLLLIPGVAFITGGYGLLHQELHPHLTHLNQSLLTSGVLFILLPIAFFSGINKGPASLTVDGQAVVSDAVRGQMLKVSRGLAIILILVYIISRFFLHAPLNGEEAGLHKLQDAPEAFKKAVEELEEEEPEINPWVGGISLAIVVVLTVVTAEFLVDSVGPIRKKISFNDEWFGLFVLPLVSYSADAMVQFGFWIRSFFNKELRRPRALADYRAIELSVQFVLFWMPLVVLLGWFSGRPMSLLFDFFEVAVLLGGCFLVNVITADSKVNWAEGTMLVSLYVGIALTAWFYPGEPAVLAMSTCNSVASFTSSNPVIFGTPPLVPQGSSAASKGRFVKGKDSKKKGAAPAKKESKAKEGQGQAESEGEEQAEGEEKPEGEEEQPDAEQSTEGEEQTETEQDEPPAATHTAVIHVRPGDGDNVPLNQKLQALLALYDVLLSGELDRPPGTQNDEL